MLIFHELFPTSYLLALAPSASPDSEAGLAAHLAQACRSGKPAVWVDCRLLDSVTPTAAWLLWACQQRLDRRHAHLILYRVSPIVEHTLRCALAGTGAHLNIVPTLDDAAALN